MVTKKMTELKKEIWENARETHTNLTGVRIKRSAKYGPHLLVSAEVQDLWELQNALQLAERMRLIFKDNKQHGALEIWFPGDRALHIPMNFSKDIKYPEIRGITLHHGPPAEPPGKYAIAPFGNKHIFDDVGLRSPNAMETDFDVFAARINDNRVGITIGEVLTNYHNRIWHKAERWAEFFNELREKGIAEEGGPTIYVVYPPGARDNIREMIRNAMKENGWTKYGYVEVSQRVNKLWQDTLKAVKILPEPERTKFLYNARTALYDAARGNISPIFAYSELSDALQRGRKYINKGLKSKARNAILQEILQFDKYYKQYGPTNATEELIKEIAKMLPGGAGNRLKKQLGI